MFENAVVSEATCGEGSKEKSGTRAARLMFLLETMDSSDGAREWELGIIPTEAPLFLGVTSSLLEKRSQEVVP